ncbi:MAG: endonuclease/exonuclease/phosphatase family metal-dependent hydrolase [Enterobacterales bacterium]|jgi:endonuclease/exonuclease/phosphatase family metal-dependent hydrolase
MNTKFLLLIVITLSLPLQADTLKVASWNIAWLGSHEYNKRLPADYDELARYAKILDADVIALQEVESPLWAKKVFGDEYEYYFSTKDWVQRVGYAVKKSLPYKVESSEYKALNVGRVRNGIDLTLSKGEKKLRLLAVHLKSGCFDKSLESNALSSMKDGTEKESKEKFACYTLSNQIKPLESWIDSRAKENIAFIVLGDFNRRFSVDIEKSYSETQGLWQAIDDDGAEDMWAPTLTKNSACWGGYYKEYIDHIVLDPKARKQYVKDSFKQLVFDQQYSQQLSQNLSDHCPISIEVEM